MLAILSIDLCASYLPWYTFVPIMSQSMVVYDATAADFNTLCMLYSLVYVPGVFGSGRLLAALGCHKCFVLATACLTAGCALRCGPAGLGLPLALEGKAGESLLPAGHAANFRWLAVGQGLCAVGQTFLVNATSHLAAEWFPPSERPAAAMISNLMNFVGGCASFVVPTWYVAEQAAQEKTHAQVAALLFAQLKVAIFTLVLTLMFYQDAPRRGIRHRLRELERGKVCFTAELWRVLSLRDFWLVNGEFTLYMAVLNTFDAVEGSLLMNYGYSEALSSYTAMSFCVTSVISTAIESVLVTRPEHYRRALIGTNGLLGLTCLLGLCSLWGGLPAWCFVLVIGVMGFSTPGWGCSLEIGSEVCYPAREATVSSLMEAFGSVASIVGIAAAQSLIDSGRSATVLVSMAGGCLCGSLALVGLSGRLRRREAEEEEAEESALAGWAPDTSEMASDARAKGGSPDPFGSGMALRPRPYDLHLV